MLAICDMISLNIPIQYVEVFVARLTVAAGMVINNISSHTHHNLILFCSVGAINDIGL